MDTENALKIIQEMIKSNKIPGAFIFEDEGGSLGNFCAEILAKAIVCQNTGHKAEFGEGCGVCEACKKADKGIHPDIIEPRPEGEGALSFHIDKVREVINGLYLLPNESDIKIYIIRGMQNMTPQGQNALLKSIEEPPPFAVFIITANTGDLILETVKSRAARFVLDDAKKRKKPPSQSYGGLICDILSDKSDKPAAYQKLSAAVLEKSDKAAVLDFYRQMENALRDILMAKIFMAYGMSGVSFLYFDGFEDAKDFINLKNKKKILNLAKNIQKYKADLDYNVNIRLN
jgi:hypothetical protein